MVGKFIHLKQPFFSFQNITQWKAVEMTVEQKGRNKCLPLTE